MNLTPEIIRLLIVFATTLLAHFVVRYGLRRAEKVAAGTNNTWDDALVAASRLPLPVFIWLGGISIVLHLVHHQTGEQLLEYLVPVRNLSFIVCVAWFLLRLIREIATNTVAAGTEKNEVIDRTTVEGLSKVARIVVFVTATLVAMQNLGFSISGVLAIGGMGGIAVGFAAKDLLSNFFGGLMLLLDRPFSVGDNVLSPDKQIEGIVEHIGWRQTVIRAPNMTPLYIPNSLFASIVVANPSRMTHRRIYETIGLRYDDLHKVQAIAADVKVMLDQHPAIDQTQVTFIALSRYSDSSIDLLVQTFCTATETRAFHLAKQDVLLQVAAIIARHGADFAFPTRTLHVKPSNSDLPL